MRAPRFLSSYAVEDLQYSEERYSDIECFDEVREAVEARLLLAITRAYVLVRAPQVHTCYGRSSSISMPLLANVLGSLG